MSASSPHSVGEHSLGISEADYLVGEQDGSVRHEYVAGQVYAMAGASGRHGRICANLLFAARAAARGGPCRVIANDMKVRVADKSIYYYPDLVVACGPDNDDDYFIDNPCFIAEVLSPSTETTDRREKLLVYRGIASLRYYLLADSRQRRVMVYSRDANNRWQQAELTRDESLAVDCGVLQFQLSLDDVYEDVVLPDQVREDEVAYG